MDIVKDIVVGLLLGVGISLCMSLLLSTVRMDYKLLEKRVDLLEETVTLLLGFRTDFLTALNKAVEEAKKKNEADTVSQKSNND